MCFILCLYLEGRLCVVKKIYEKPMIAVEHYALTQTIASCESKVNATGVACLPDEWKNLGSVGYFYNGYESCKQYPEGMDKYDKICYHTSSSTAFAS